MSKPHQEKKFREQLPLESLKRYVMKSKSLTIASAIITNYYIFLLMKLKPSIYTNSARTLLKLNIREEIIKAKKEFYIYCKYGSLTTKQIQDKTVLEIGTGANYLVPLLFLANGAKKVLTIDKFYCLRSEKELFQLYLEFYKTLNLKQRKNLDRVLKFEDNTCQINSKFLEYKQIEIAKLPESEKFDINISYAVFEHIYNVDEAFRKISQVLKTEGKFLALVDVSDHGFFSVYHDPLYYFNIRPGVWHRMIEYSGRPNRVLPDKYCEIMKKYRFNSKIHLIKIRFQEKELKEYINLKYFNLHNYKKAISKINKKRHTFSKEFKDTDIKSLLTEKFLISAVKK